MKLSLRPLPRECWNDVDTFFKARGCSVARGCRCMFYRHSHAPTPLRRSVTRAEASRLELTGSPRKA